MKRKTLCILIVFAMLATLLVSCTAKPDAQPNSSTLDSSNPALTGELTYFTFLATDGGYPENVLESFKKKYPNVTVKLERGSSTVEEYLQLQKVKLLSSENIDVTTVRPESRTEYVNSGYLVDVTDQPFMKNYNPSYVDLIKVNDRAYGIPASLDIIGVMYNKDMFAEKGWKVPANYDEFITLCDAIKASGMMVLMNGGKDGWPMEMDVYPFLHDVLVKDHEIFSKIDSGEAKYTDKVFVDAFTKIDEFYKKGYVAKETVGMGYDQSATYFAQGKTAMILQGEWFMANYSSEDSALPFEVGTFPIPHNAPNEPQVTAVSIGATNVITAFSKNSDAALAFLEHLSSVESGTFYAESGNFSPVLGVTSENIKIWEEMMKMPSVDFFYNLQYPGANSEMIKGLQMMILGEKTPKQLCEDVQAMQEKKNQ